MRFTRVENKGVPLNVINRPGVAQAVKIDLTMRQEHMIGDWCKFYSEVIPTRIYSAYSEYSLYLFVRNT